MRRFTVFSPFGLSNRLKVLLSGQVLAEAAGAELEVLWPLTGTCMCPYERLFVPDPRVKTVPEGAIEGLPTVVGWDAPPPDLLRERGAHVVVGYMSWLVRPALFPGHEALWPRLGEKLAALEPLPLLKDTADAFAATCFRPRMIGVHLRRGDFNGARPDVIANTEAAIAIVERHLAEDPEAGVYLATDDGAVAGDQRTIAEGVRGLLRERFGERVVWTTPRSLDRAVPEAIEDALVDLLLLRKTVAIVGTASSSFSELGAFGRGVPCEMTEGTHERMLRFEAFARKVGAYPVIMQLARWRLGREPKSFFMAWHAVRYTATGDRIMKVVHRLVPRWRP